MSKLVPDTSSVVHFLEELTAGPAVAVDRVTGPGEVLHAVNRRPKGFHLKIHRSSPGFKNSVLDVLKRKNMHFFLSFYYFNFKIIHFINAMKWRGEGRGGGLLAF